MKSEHTKGPWEAILETLPEVERFGLTMDDARRADAAPALLEALEEIVEEARDAERECRTDWDYASARGDGQPVAGGAARACLDLAIVYRERIEGLARTALALVRGDAPEGKDQG